MTLSVIDTKLGHLYHHIQKFSNTQLHKTNYQLSKGHHMASARQILSTCVNFYRKDPEKREEEFRVLWLGIRQIVEENKRHYLRESWEMDDVRLCEETEKLRDAVKAEATTILSEACENGAVLSSFTVKPKETNGNYNNIDEAPKFTKLAPHLYYSYIFAQGPTGRPMFQIFVSVFLRVSDLIVFKIRVILSYNGLFRFVSLSSTHGLRASWPLIYLFKKLRKYWNSSTSSFFFFYFLIPHPFLFSFSLVWVAGGWWTHVASIFRRGVIRSCASSSTRQADSTHL